MIFGSVAIANGRDYLMSAEQMYGVGSKDAKAQDAPLPEFAKESDSGDRAATQMLVTPADVVLRPGEKKQFAIKLFDAMGRPVNDGAPKSDWSIGQLTLPPPP